MRVAALLVLAPLCAWSQNDHGIRREEVETDAEAR